MEVPARAVVVPEPSRRPLRKGVILAAGLSTRMAPLSNGRSKAMLRLGGLTLLERAIRTLRTLDLEQILIVIGHDMAGVGEHAKRVGGGGCGGANRRWGGGERGLLASPGGPPGGGGTFLLGGGAPVFA